MTEQAKYCKGITLNGIPCRRHIRWTDEYCHNHRSKQQKQKDEKKIKEFLTKHKKELLMFFAGTTSGPISSDVYDFFKEMLGMQHLVPPIRKEDGTDNVSRSFKEKGDYTSFVRLLSLLQIDMNRSEYLKLMGKPTQTRATGYDTGAVHMDIYFAKKGWLRKSGFIVCLTSQTSKEYPNDITLVEITYGKAMSIEQFLTGRWAPAIGNYYYEA